MNAPDQPVTIANVTYDASDIKLERRDLENPLELILPLPGFEDVLRVLKADRAFLAIVRNRPTCTREKGRRYDRSRVCPKCFSSFTSKGFWRHAAVCKS